MRRLLSGILCALPSGLLATPAIAQIVDNAAPLSQQTLQELDRNNRSNFSVGNGNFDVMQLIHNANLLNGRSPEQFRREQDESLDAAVKEFRLQQQQKIDAPQSTMPQ